MARKNPKFQHQPSRRRDGKHSFQKLIAIRKARHTRHGAGHEFHRGYCCRQGLQTINIKMLITPAPQRALQHMFCGDIGDHGPRFRRCEQSEEFSLGKGQNHNPNKAAPKVQAATKRCARLSNMGRPSMPPIRGSTRSSGCGISPQTRKLGDKIPAILRALPLRLAASVAWPASST